jgi:hypothetical protein
MPAEIRPIIKSEKRHGRLRMKQGLVNRKAFARRLRTLIEQHPDYGNRYRFERAHPDLGHSTATAWFEGKSLPTAEWLAFLARTLGVTTNYLLFGEGSPHDLAERLDDYVRSHLKAAGVPQAIIDYHLLAPADMLQTYLEINLEEVRLSELERQSHVFARIQHEDSERSWGSNPPILPDTVRLHSKDEMRSGTEESVMRAGDPRTWSIGRPRRRDENSR